MSEEKLLTVRDVSLVLGVSEKEVLDLAESGRIPAYKIGGVYLRFKKEQVQEYRKLNNPPAPLVKPLSKNALKGKISDFFYFNDFYVLSVLIITLLLVIILRGY